MKAMFLSALGILIAITSLAPAHGVEIYETFSGRVYKERNVGSVGIPLIFEPYRETSHPENERFVFRLDAPSRVTFSGWSAISDMELGLFKDSSLVASTTISNSLTPDYSNIVYSPPVTVELSAGLYAYAPVSPSPEQRYIFYSDAERLAAPPKNPLDFDGGDHGAIKKGTDRVELDQRWDDEANTSNIFTKTFSFTLDTLSNVTFYGKTIGSSLFPPVAVGLFNSSGDLLAGSIFSPYSYDAYTTVQLNSGSYYYAPVFPEGKQGEIGSYFLTSEVSPVPEISVYAMMLAGLGVIGLIKRRRDKSALG